MNLSGVSIETTLELWASSLRDVKARMRPLFTQQRVAASASLFLDGLLGSEPRKTGWMRAEAAGDPGPWRQQAILGRGHWDADALRDVVRDYALETLADSDAVLVLDETGFLKQGTASCAVARQYHRVCGQDHQLPNRRVCRLRLAARSRVPRPGAVCAQGVGGRPGAARGSARPGCGQLRDQAADRAWHDRAGPCRQGAVRLGGGRHGVWRG